MIVGQRLLHDHDAIPYELVERKGVGHPDTMCDAMAERMSTYYARYCLKNFGAVAHHWFDKVALYGGESDISFGIGELTSPYKVRVFGKGAYRVGSIEIPLREILVQAASDVLTEVTTGFDPERHLVMEVDVVDHQGSGRKNSRYRPNSIAELTPLSAENLVSNDTNLLHGYAPLSTLESAVSGIEHLINGAEFKAANPDSGWDVKVFGSRRGRHFSFVVNMPFLGRFIASMDAYWDRKGQVASAVRDHIASYGIDDYDLLFNATDRNGRAYLTALGSVADTGDVGVVGRGNRVNGLITPMRPMSIEAPAGKNPLDHTGKIYNLLAMRLAQDVSLAYDAPSEVHIFTSKEAPLLAPDEVVVKVPEPDARLEEIAAAAIQSVPTLTEEFINKGVVLW